MIPDSTELPVVYLKPGELYFVRQPTIVVTIVGSCIAVTMFHSYFKVGTICHSLLPYGNGDNGFKYVDCSIRRMVREYDFQGIQRDEIEVKLFGGSDMFTVTERISARLTVGHENIRAAENVLREENLKILNRDTGGVRGRKLYFNTDTGEVFLKRLK